MLLLAINILLLAVGCFLDPLSAILLLSPLLVPMIKAVGIDPVHFGIVVTVNLAIGLFHPPFGINIFVAQTVLGLKLETIYRGIIPFVVIYLIALAHHHLHPGHFADRRPLSAGQMTSEHELGGTFPCTPTLKTLAAAGIAACGVLAALPAHAQQFTMKLSQPTINDVTHEYFKRMKAGIESASKRPHQGRHLSGEPARPASRRRRRRGARHHRSRRRPPTASGSASSRAFRCSTRPACSTTSRTASRC